MFVMVMLDELRLAIRTLLRRPLFTIAVVATLGLGVGASTTVFSVVHGVLFKPLPYAEPDRLVGVFRFLPRLMGPSVASIVDWYAVPFALYLDWQDRSANFENLGAYAPAGLTVTGDDNPERVTGARITAGVFEALGIEPLRGQPLRHDDDRVGMPPRVILSYGFWERRFGADRDVIGTLMTISGTSHIVTSVMPRTFHFPSEAEELWVTFSDEQRTSTFRKGGNLKVIGRLEPGVSIERARQDMERVRTQLAEVYPIENDFGTRVIARSAMVGADARPGLLLLLGAVGAVLLVTCANIANLLLIRATERRKEIALRHALGAARGRLLVQVVSESLVLALAGGGVGCVLAMASVRPFVALFPDDLPRASEIAVDARALLFALGVSTLVGLLIGALPAFRAANLSLTDAFAAASRSYGGGHERNRAQALLVVGEIALAFLLLVGAGLFVRSFGRLMAVDPGFVPERVLTMRVSLPDRTYSSDEAIRAFYADLLERLAAVPGVETAASVGQMPFMGGRSFPPTSVETLAGVVEASVHETSVSSDYFRALRVPIVAGRYFGPEDGPGTAPVVIVNQTLTDRFWPGENPLGQRIRNDSARGEPT